MTVELGHFAVLLALLVALLQGLLPLVAGARGQALARPAAGLQFGLLALGFAALLQAFVTHDFSVAIVAAHSQRELPLLYRFSALWGGHEGSLLLWVLLLALWGALLAWRAPGRLPPAFAARVLAVLGLLGAGFLGFLLLTSNPFARLSPVPLDGHDLNPLLQDPGMALHPPLLYLGYVGLALPYAFAVAALLEGPLQGAEERWQAWTEAARPWALAAWSCLGGGILLGSFWAYYELGWGGWWFWDAVENAAFMPWLVGTALLHSLAVSARPGGAFRHWTLLLALLGFALSLLGTFLVRSGVVSSVHAFASDPQRGLFILGLLGAAVLGGFGLYGWRALQLRAPAPAKPLQLGSRAGLLMLNNVLLAAACGTVLLGTLYPLVLDALGAPPISVGAPYFDTVFVPLMLPLLALLGLGPWRRWDAHEPWQAQRPLLPLALGAVASAVVGALVWQQGLGFALGLAAGLWVLASTLALALRGSWATWRGGPRPPLPRWGQWLAHAGLGLFVLGVTASRHFEQTHEFSLATGQGLHAGALHVTLESVRTAQGTNYRALQAQVRVEGPEGQRWLLQPEKRLYGPRQVVMTEAALQRQFGRDLYLSLGEALPDGRWSLRLQVKPGMTAIWLGALAIALGGGLAAWGRRQPRPQLGQQAAPTGVPTPKEPGTAPPLDLLPPPLRGIP